MDHVKMARMLIESVLEAEEHPTNKGQAKKAHALASFTGKLSHLPGVDHLKSPALQDALNKNVDDVIACFNTGRHRIDLALMEAASGK